MTKEKSNAKGDDDPSPKIEPNSIELKKKKDLLHVGFEPTT